MKCRSVVLGCMSILFIGLAIVSVALTGNQPKQANAQEMARTMVAPTMEIPLGQHQNLVYCSTFQLAWNELRDNIIGEDIKLDKPLPLVDSLNKEKSTKGDLSPDSYVALTGFGKDNILGKINASLRAKFGSQAPLVKEKLKPDDIMAYAYLYKNLEFAHEFEKLAQPISFTDSDGSTISVKGFGIKSFAANRPHSDLSAQVSVIDYRSDSDFILQLDSKSNKDEIILAKVSPRQTLMETVNYVQARVADGQRGAMAPGDTLQIPDIDLYLRHSYTELQDRGVRNKGFEQYYIRKAVQDTKFVLDERGAVLESEARIVMAKSCILPTASRSKMLIFDRPFLVFIEDKNSKVPYFALWVNNTEVLQPQGQAGTVLACPCNIVPPPSGQPPKALQQNLIKSGSGRNLATYGEAYH